METPEGTDHLGLAEPDSSIGKDALVIGPSLSSLSVHVPMPRLQSKDQAATAPTAAPRRSTASGNSCQDRDKGARTVLFEGRPPLRHDSTIYFRRLRCESRPISPKKIMAKSDHVLYNNTVVCMLPVSDGSLPNRPVLECIYWTLIPVSYTVLLSTSVQI